ncbi:MAG: DUF1223 domain-containing protein [Myxococcota bacterium]
MRALVVVACAALTVGLAACLSLSSSPGALADDAPTPQPGAQPILVELFTSQGCSSCPPADQVLSRLGQGEWGTQVVPLSFHVDYWNYIGWNDPFSSEAWSNRQRLYARSMGSSRIYTPQLVVQGREHLVGSRERDAHRQIRAALKRRPAVAIELKLKRSASALDITIDTRLQRAIASERLALWVATYENGLTTQVKRGENGGETLHNDHVVRAMKRVSGVEGAEGSTFVETLSVPVKAGWDAAKLGVVAFVQDTKTMEVHGVAVVRP